MARLDPIPQSLRFRDTLAGEQAGDRTGARYTPESSTREFVDNDGNRWTVREIVPEMRPRTHRTLLTRPGYENGWLSFRSVGLSCRIAPFPEHWRTISDYEIERWCMRARDAARTMRKSSRPQ